MSLSNKVVIVTGSSSGIGASTAILFAKEGANVTIVGRNENKLQNVAAKIREIGKEPLVIVADVSKDEEAKRIIEETVGKFRKLDVLVNNAGILNSGSIIDGSILQAFDEVMNINVRAVINLTTLATPHLIQTKGNIVNISSVASQKIPDPSFSAYSVSKAALDQFTKAASKELASSGIRVNSVNPGPVIKDILENSGITEVTYDARKVFTALNRVSEPEEIGELILYLAGDKAKGITGSIFVSDNGTLVK